MRYIALIAILFSGCTPLPYPYGSPDFQNVQKAFTDVEQCESQASTATGLYKAGVSDGRTWLDIKNDCLRKR